VFDWIYLDSWGLVHGWIRTQSFSCMPCFYPLYVGFMLLCFD